MFGARRLAAVIAAVLCAAGSAHAQKPDPTAGLTAAVAADNAASLVRPAHTLKSSSATLGAMRLSAVARELEMAGRSGTLESSAQGDLDTAQAEWDAAAAALASWLERASAE